MNMPYTHYQKKEKMKKKKEEEKRTSVTLYPKKFQSSNLGSLLLVQGVEVNLLFLFKHFTRHIQ